MLIERIKICKFVCIITLANCIAFAKQNQDVVHTDHKILKEAQNTQSPNSLNSTNKSAKLDLNNEKELIDILHLMPNESRQYVMKGTIGNEMHEAYVWVGKNEYRKDFNIIITLPSVYDVDSNIETINISLNECEIGMEYGKLTIKGVWSKTFGAKSSSLANKEFVFRVCDTCNLHEIDFMMGYFEKEQVVKNKSLSYFKSLSVPFIPSNNKIPRDVRNRINSALYSTDDKKAIANRLKKEAKLSFSKITKNKGELLVNSEYINNYEIGYVSPDLLMFLETRYIYEGGAHGNTLFNVRAFSLQNGEELPTGIEAMLDIKKRDKVLSILTSKLQPQAHKLYKLPISELPDIFMFDNSGIIFIWQTYSIAPYSSGLIRVHVDFKELKNLIREDSVYKFLLQNKEYQ